MSETEQENIVERVIESLEKKGLVVVKASYLNELVESGRKKSNLLRKKWLTPYRIAKNELIPNVTTVRTVKNMMKDGRIGVNEFYKDSFGKYFVLTDAVKRLANE